MNTDQPINTREEAVLLNLAKYWTGKPCRAGHAALRYTSSGACIACNDGYRRRFARKDQSPSPGMVPVTLLVHGEDLQTVRDFVAALTFARSLE